MGSKQRNVRRHSYGRGINVISVRNIRLPVGHGAGDVLDEMMRILCLDKIYPGNSYPDLSYRILRRSIDARKKPHIYYVYTVMLLCDSAVEERIRRFHEKNAKKPQVRRFSDKIITDPPAVYSPPECGNEKLSRRPVVTGSGPAGMFCALLLARAGFRPIVIERGENVDDRSRTVAAFWEGGNLSDDSNVSFGEGGAGTFSDGKLNTLTKDTNGRNSFVIRTFYEHGAPEEILYDAKPHIGTDILKSVVKNIRSEITALGGEFMFNTRLTDISDADGKLSGITVMDVATGTVRDIETDICVLCTGHSARDTFEMLYRRNVRMSAKNFAAGFRVAHPQALVNKWQYGTEDPEEIHLPPADYKVTNETAGGRRVYSFCMCPGGYVVNASSEAGGICVNGMSEHGRDGQYANSAIIAAVTPDDYIQDEVPPGHPLAGMYYQRRIEAAAYERGRGCIPFQRFSDYETGTASETVLPDGMVKGTTAAANLKGIFSGEMDEAIIESMHKFGYTMKGFDAGDVYMFGVEARTSSPVRIGRDDGFESNIKGLYPCGEGAGYAGGIVSAAADGIRCAEKIIERYISDGDECGE